MLYLIHDYIERMESMESMPEVLKNSGIDMRYVTL
jgi:hypothetical protein